MRKRFATPWALFWITLPQNFFAELPTDAERRAFGEAFPQQFFGMWAFFSHVTDDMPASTEYHFRVFKRPADEFLAMIEAHPPCLPFDPPNVRALHFYPEQIETMAAARGRWWRANKLPMTDAEADWLKRYEKITSIRKENQ